MISIKKQKWTPDVISPDVLDIKLPKLEFAIVDISSDLLMNLYCPRVSYTGNLRCRNIRQKINFIKSKLYRYMKQTHVM